MEDLSESVETLKRNFWEYKRAVKFVGLKEENIEQVINDQMKMVGTPDLEDLETEADERKNYLNEVSTSLSRLEQGLSQLEDLFTTIKGVKRIWKT